MIIGTAGHIDHGKTALVRALTGVDTDRLPEEKRRGITIDLGFAPLVLEGAGTLSLVDVPGHDAFVRTMVAGASGVDVALLVVAADEGVMPQTREHVAILELLGVPRAVVALTKCDLAAPDWLALVEEDVLALLASTRFRSSPLVPVSALTGHGLPALRTALAAAAAQEIARSADDLFRLPIDRAFTVRGTGTVVTGTVWSGALARDDTLRLFPGDRVVRARGVQAHGRTVERAAAGTRAAVALAGVALDEVGRGAVLVGGAGWSASRILRADVSLLRDAGLTLGARTRVRVHLGTTETGGRLVVTAGQLLPGAEAPARVVLDEPVVARAGDRFVVRAASPAVTVGGGVVSDPHAPPRARPWPAIGAAVRERLGWIARGAGAEGVDVHTLPVRLGIAPAEASALAAEGELLALGGRLLAPESVAALERRVRSRLEDFHRDRPLEPGAPIQWVRAGLGAGASIASDVVGRLVEGGEVVLDGPLVRTASHRPALSAGQAALRDRLLDRLASTHPDVPDFGELANALGATPDEVGAVARFLARRGVLVAVEPDRYYPQATVAELLERLRGAMATGAELAPGELRETLGFTRKFLIPFLEYCDREGYTVRTPTGHRSAGEHLRAAGGVHS